MVVKFNSVRDFRDALVTSSTLSDTNGRKMMRRILSIFDTVEDRENMSTLKYLHKYLDHVIKDHKDDDLIKSMLYSIDGEVSL